MAGIVEYVARHSPKQSEIVVALQKRILDGDLRPGSEVPSLLELAQLHKASTRTVQSAMHHLRRLGYIQSVRGVGSRVCAAPPHLCNFALALPNVTQSFYKGLCVEAATIFKDSESDCLPRRISSFQLDMGHGPGDGYVKLTAGTPPLTIKVFTITDQSTGSPRFTNSALVDVLISAMGGGGEIDGYLVTTSDVAPTEGWLPEPPTTATLTSTGDVTLYAWARNTLGDTAGKAATIHYDTATPEVSNVAITAGAPGTANSDMATLGAVQYAVQGTGNWTTVSESELATAHSVTITGIAGGTTYQVVIINNEIAQPAMLYPKGCPIPGDCNGDCRVNILDLIFIRNRLNQDVYTGDNCKADVNEDNRVNILDLIFVRNRLNTMCPYMT